MDGDAEPVEGLAQVTAGLRGQPGAQLAAGGERDREVGSGLRELGGGLDAGQPLTDDQHGAALAQAGQALAQAQRRGPAGHIEGVLGHAGDAVVGHGAAERVEERVVREFALLALRAVCSVCAGQGDGPALGVDAGDARQAQPYPGAREDVGELADREVLADRELVEPHPLDEVGHGVDDGDLGVGGGEPTGQVPGGEGPGVSGAEYDDAVLHDGAPVSFAVPLERDGAPIADRTPV